MTKEVDNLPKPSLLLIALLQGLALLLLHEAVTFEFWPGKSYRWLFALYAVVVVGPLMLLLSLEKGEQWKRIAGLVAPFTVAAGLLGFYTGGQVLTEPRVDFDMVGAVFGFTLAIATFKALMYAQQRAAGGSIQYSVLFQFSWRNFLTLGLSLLFTLAVWGILMLWGELFKVIGIDFFHDLFTERWFYYPALALAHGFGVITFRSQSKVIDTITRIQQALMKFLLVFLVLVSLFFLAALPFTGLTLLWETGSGSLLILWMQGIMLFFLNAVYQDDPEARPYPVGLHRFIYLGIALLPVYSAIIFYGLWLRVDQYGWTPSRSWGFLIWALFALFSLGYLWGIVRQRDNWLRHLSWVNVRMGLVVLALMLLVNSPLLDFRKIAVTSQLSRLTSGELEPEELDLRHFRYDLARPGHLALQELKTEFATSHPKVAAEIEKLYSNPQNVRPEAISRTEFIKSLNIFASGSLPLDLEIALHDFALERPWQMLGLLDVYLLQLDIDSDGKEDDYVLISDREGYRQATLFHHNGVGWYELPMTVTSAGSRNAGKLLDDFREGRWAARESRWKYVEVGGLVLQVALDKPAARHIPPNEGRPAKMQEARSR